MTTKKRVLRLITILTFIILITQSVLAQEKLSDYNNYNELKLEFNIGGKFTLVKTSNDAKVAEVNSYLSFFPKEDIMQKINSFNTYSSPTAKTAKGTEEIAFSWTNPDNENFNFGVDAEITTSNIFPIIDEKIQFPIEEGFNFYTQPTEFIDITPEIRQRAEEIANGEDDLYLLAFKAALWVQQNVEYNLTTLTADVVQKSSWVLRNKEGVCDELTNLFISIMRSLGIPARFVSGMAYTNLGNKWSPHGWAEVYFPDKGWIPFDVTYGQFGWVDPTHIKLKVNKDSGEPAIRYNWKAIDTQLSGKEIELSTKIISKGNEIQSPLSFKVKSLVNNVGPGSFAPIELEIKNNNNYYIPNTFVVTKATNLTEKNFKSIILKPGEIKNLFWITEIPKNIDEGYIYFSTIEIEDQFHTKATANITYKKDFQTISLREAKEMIEKDYQVIESKIISNKLSLECNAPKTATINDEIKIDCKLKNKGNTKLDNINVCYLKDCREISLSITEEKNVKFILKDPKPGLKNINIEATNHNTKASDLVNIEILENPGLQIAGAEYPETINYKDQFKINLILNTKIPVKDVKIKMNEEEIGELSKVDSVQQITIESKGKDLFKNNEIKIIIEFKDLNDKLYTVEALYNIQITNVPWYIELLRFFSLI